MDAQSNVDIHADKHIIIYYYTDTLVAGLVQEGGYPGDAQSNLVIRGL